MLRTWAVRLPAMTLTESVRSFQVPATPLDLGLSAELAFGADFAGHARHFRRERAKLIDHRVDGPGSAEKFSLEGAVIDFEGHRLREIALGNRTDHSSRFDRWVDEIVDQVIDRFELVAPETGRIADRKALREFPLFADDAAEARHFLRYPFIQFNHFVEGIRHLARNTVPVDGEADSPPALPQGGRGARRAVISLPLVVGSRRAAMASPDQRGKGSSA